MRQDARKQVRKRERKKPVRRDCCALIYFRVGPRRGEIRATESQLAWMAHHDWVMP